MTLLEFAEKTSPVPLTAWQRDFLTMYEQAVRDGTKLICMPGRIDRRMMTKDIVNQYYSSKPIEVYCQGTKKIEYRCIKCNKLLGKFSVNSEFEIVCPRCKTVNKKDVNKNV